jgi:hypothetical protein
MFTIFQEALSIFIKADVHDLAISVSAEIAENRIKGPNLIDQSLERPILEHIIFP